MRQLLCHIDPFLRLFLRVLLCYFEEVYKTLASTNCREGIAEVKS